MNRVQRVVAMVVCTVTLGCDTAELPPSKVDNTDFAGSVLRIANTVENSELRPVCGTRDRTPHVVIALRAGTCYSCRSIGRIVRDYITSPAQQEGPMWIVTPSDDAATTCEFFKREHTPVAVFALADDMWRFLASSQDGIAFRPDAPSKYQIIDAHTVGLTADLLDNSQ